MKRGGPLQRKTPLTSSKPLPRSTPLPRTPLARRAPQKPAEGLRRAKPLSSARPKVTTEERRARKLVRARSGGVCEICGRARASNFQHRQNRSQSGAWTAENGLDACGTGTTGCHGRIHAFPSVAYERGWSVRSGHDPADVPVWLAGRGWSFLTPDGDVVPAERSAA